MGNYLASYICTKILYWVYQKKWTNFEHHFYSSLTANNTSVSLEASPSWLKQINLRLSFYNIAQ